MSEPAPNQGPRLPDLGRRGEGWVLGQFVLLGLLLVVSLPRLPVLAPTDVPGWLAVGAGAAALAIGASLLLSGFRALGPSLTPLPRPHERAVLVESGIYSAIRHPIYAGLIVGGLGWAALTRSFPAVAVAALLAIFLDVKSRREEAWLRERYPAYQAYVRRTRRFVPRIY